MNRNKFELVFEGGAVRYFTRYKRHHATHEAAAAEAQRVFIDLEARGYGSTINGHSAIVYGPGCGPDGTAVPAFVEAEEA